MTPGSDSWTGTEKDDDARLIDAAGLSPPILDRAEVSVPPVVSTHPRTMPCRWMMQSNSHSTLRSSSTDVVDLSGGGDVPVMLENETASPIGTRDTSPLRELCVFLKTSLLPPDGERVDLTPARENDGSAHDVDDALDMPCLSLEDGRDVRDGCPKGNYEDSEANSVDEYSSVFDSRSEPAGLENEDRKTSHYGGYEFIDRGSPSVDFHEGVNADVFLSDVLLDQTCYRIGETMHSLGTGVPSREWTQPTCATRLRYAGNSLRLSLGNMWRRTMRRSGMRDRIHGTIRDKLLRFSALFRTDEMSSW